MTSMRREEPAWPPPPVRSWSLAFRPSVTACMRIFIPLEGVEKLTCKLIALHILPLWAHSYFGLGAPELITQHSSLSESEISPNQNTFSKNLKRLQILHWKWIQHFYLKTLQNILWDGFWHPNRYSLGPKLIKIVTFFHKISTNSSLKMNSTFLSENSQKTSYEELTPSLGGKHSF